MDDALIPTQLGGGSKLAVQIFAALSVILVVVSVICAFIKGSQQYYTGYIVVAIAMALIVGSTFVLVRWILSDELPESKHSYVVGFQFFGLMILAAGMLASVYSTFPQEYAVYGMAAVNGTGQGQVTLKGTSIKGEALSVTASFSQQQQLFGFQDHIKENSEYTLTVTDPTTAQCTPKSTTGTANADVKFQIQCVEAFQLKGIMAGILTSPFELQATDYKGSTPIIQTLSVSNNGPFTFASGIISGDAYQVEPKTQPTDATCTITGGQSGTAGPGMPQVSVTCTKKN